MSQSWQIEQEVVVARSLWLGNVKRTKAGLLYFKLLHQEVRRMVHWDLVHCA